MSIRSGRGAATHDRVLRLLPIFDSASEAADHALLQGMAWIAARVAAPAPAGMHSHPLTTSSNLHLHQD